MDKKITNNQVVVGGTITKEFEFNNELFGEKFYVTTVSVKRTSGAEDLIPIMVSERLVSVNEEWSGTFVAVSGQFRSYNLHENEKNRLILSVFAREFEVLEKEENINKIFLDGFLVKPPIYRGTPLGREITEILLAANRPYGKSDYIPCIIWGRNARFASGFEVGTHLMINGRIQSREYTKCYPDGTEETRIAYEVSVSRVEEIGKTEE